MCSLSIEITVCPNRRNERKFWASKIGGPTWMKTTSLQTFNQKFDHWLAANCTANMEVLENMLVQAGIHHGTVLKFRMHFQTVNRVEDIEAFSEALSNTSRSQNPEFADSKVTSSWTAFMEIQVLGNVIEIWFMLENVARKFASTIRTTICTTTTCGWIRLYARSIVCRTSCTSIKSSIDVGSTMDMGRPDASN